MLRVAFRTRINAHIEGVRSEGLAGTSAYLARFRFNAGTITVPTCCTVTSKAIDVRCSLTPSGTKVLDDPTLGGWTPMRFDGRTAQQRVEEVGV